MSFTLMSIACPGEQYASMVDILTIDSPHTHTQAYVSWDLSQLSCLSRAELHPEMVSSRDLGTSVIGILSPSEVLE